MAENSKIEWTHHTFNPWRGCSKVHAGCTHCYAETNMSVKLHGIKWGPNGTRVRASDAMWREPLKWNREAAQAGERRRVFCASLADVFEDWRGPVLDHKGGTILKCESCINPDGTFAYESVAKYEPSKLMCEHGCGEKSEAVTLDDLRRDLFALIDSTPNLDWLLLTKRPENAQRMWRVDGNGKDPGADDYLRRENVWLGTSISDQETADAFVPRLLQCRELCPVLFLSAEPLLGPVNLQPHLTPSGGFVNSQGINCDWVIVGGESGKDARPCNIEWIRSIVEQCASAGVPVFVKQLGSNAHEHVVEDMAKRMFPGGVPAGVHVSGHYEHRCDFKTVHKKGGDMAEWPESIQVRQFPSIQAV